MKLNSVKNYLIYSYFFLAPTGIAGLLSGVISFNGRVPTGGVVLLMLLYFSLLLFQKPRWLTTALDIPFVALIVLKITAFLYVVYFYYGIDGDFLKVQRNMMVSIVLIYFSYFILFRFINLQEKNIEKIVMSFSLGSITSMVGVFVLAYFFWPSGGVAGLAELKRNIYLGATALQQNLSIEGPAASRMAFNWMSSVELTVGLGPLLAMLTVFFLSYSTFSKYNVIYKFLSFFLLISTVLTVSRSAVLGVFVGLWAVFFGYYYFVNRNLSDFFYKNLFFFISLLIVVFAYFLVTGIGEDIQNENRTSLWINSMLLIIHNPFGYGQDYINLVSEYNVDRLPAGITFSHDHAHNAFLQFGIETGVFGMFVFAYVFILSLYVSFKNLSILRKFRQRRIYFSRELLGLSLALFAGLLTALVGMIFESSFLGRPGVYSCVLIGLLALNMKINYDLRKICISKI